MGREGVESWGGLGEQKGQLIVIDSFEENLRRRDEYPGNIILSIYPKKF